MYGAQIFLTTIDTFTVITFMNTTAAFKIIFGHMLCSLLGDKR